MKQRFLTYPSLLLGGCSAEIPEVCTQQLVLETISIVDSAGEPVSEVELQLINTRTGEPLCGASETREKRQNCREELGEVHPGSGVYAIVTSLNVGRFSIGDVKDGDTIEVTGTKDDKSFTEQYLVHTDLGPCHPTGIDGPQTIVLE